MEDVGGNQDAVSTSFLEKETFLEVPNTVQVLLLP